jgi:hypothetical protein
MEESGQLIPATPSSQLCLLYLALGIGTGSGLSALDCADGDAFGMGTGNGLSIVACADAVVIKTTPKMNVPIVFFKFPPSVVTRLQGAKEQQKSGA